MQAQAETLCYTVPEMAQQLQVGLNKAYELANREGFPTVRFGKNKIRIPKDDLKAWLSEQVKKGGHYDF